MTQRVFNTAGEAAAAMADHAAAQLRQVLAARPGARLVAATGASQIEFLSRWTTSPGIDWTRIELFHLDEYIGLPAGHPASFQRFIRERILQPTGILNAHLLDGSAVPREVCAGAAQAVSKAPVDLIFAGVGENGHLAFNEPPADFQTSEPFVIVDLDPSTLQQQVREGWFGRMEDVPKRAITMSIPQILKAREVLCIATGVRKAAAVKRCFEAPISPAAPASALRMHARATVFLDRAAASELSQS